jgi:tetratricopeptide (TPR) repeat protein
LLLSLCLVLLVAGRAHAQDPGLAAAKRHFERATKLFNLGKFSEALEEYEAAYDAKPLPDFLFNIGQCYRNLGDYDQAILTFKKLLKEQPQDADREAVQRVIDELEAKRDRQSSEKLGLDKKPTEPRPPRPASSSPIYTTWWFWTGVAVVGVAGGVGIYAVTRPTVPETALGNIVFGK